MLKTSLGVPWVKVHSELIELEVKNRKNYRSDEDDTR